MKKLLFITVILSLFFSCDKSPLNPSEMITADNFSTAAAMSCTGVITFAKNYGGEFASAHSVINTTDGGYALFGENSSSFLLIKTDRYGNLQWQKNYGIPGHQYGYCVRETPDGGFIMIGMVVISDVEDNTDALIIKVDRSGTIQWQRTVGGTEIDYGYSIALSQDNGYVGTGFISINPNSPSYERKLLLFKLDANGTILWQKTYGSGRYSSGYSIERTSDNGFIVAGTISSSSQGSQDMGDQMYLLKVTASGSFQFQKTFGGPFYDEAYSVKQTRNGGYIMAGKFNLSSAYPPLQEAYLIRTDSRGNVLWRKGYFPSQNATANSICETSDGGFTFTGSLYMKGALVKVGSNGNFIWRRSFANNKLQTGEDIVSTSDGGFAIAGKGGQAALVKTDRNGRL